MIHNVTQPMYEDYVAESVRGSDLVEIRKNHSFVVLQNVCIFLGGWGFPVRVCWC